MTDDLLSRLRRARNMTLTHGALLRLCEQAADEIEQMEDEIERMDKILWRLHADLEFARDQNKRLWRALSEGMNLKTIPVNIDTNGIIED